MHGGVAYRCVNAFAAAKGVTTAAVYKALSRHGTLDCVGKPRGGRYNYCKPVQFGPHKWPSISAMARDLGIDRSGLAKKLKHGRDQDTILGLVMRYERKVADAQSRP